MKYYIYIVRCEDGSLYTGITTDPRRRMREHVLHLPSGAKYTRSHQVVALAALWSAENRSAASMLEAAIKRLPSKKKRTLVQNPDLLCHVLSTGFDADAYRAEPVFPLDDLLQDLSKQ